MVAVIRSLCSRGESDRYDRRTRRIRCNRRDFAPGSITGTALLGLVTAEPHEPDDAEHAQHGRQQQVEADAEDLVRGIDAHRLEEEAPERVQRDVQRERLPLQSRDAAFDHTDRPNTMQAPDRLVEERGLERRVLAADTPAGGARGSISSPHGSVVGFPNSSWLK